MPGSGSHTAGAVPGPVTKSVVVGVTVGLATGDAPPEEVTVGDWPEASVGTIVGLAIGDAPAEGVPVDCRSAVGVGTTVELAIDDAPPEGVAVGWLSDEEHPAHATTRKSRGAIPIMVRNLVILATSPGSPVQ